jgi:hypothetical protein
VAKLTQQQSKDTKTIIQQNEQIDKMKERLGKYEPLSGGVSPIPAPSGSVPSITITDPKKLQEEVDSKTKAVEVLFPCDPCTNCSKELERKLAILTKSKETDTKKYHSKIKTLEAENAKLKEEAQKGPRRKT